MLFYTQAASLSDWNSLKIFVSHHFPHRSFPYIHQDCNSLPVYRPDDQLPKVDAIIVTPIWDYQNIEKIYLNMIFLAEKFNEFFRLIERNLKKNRKIIKLDIY